MAPYQELERLLDTKQAKLTQHITIWNFLGLLGGAILCVALMQLTGWALLAPIPVVIGVGLTIRRRNMLLAQRMAIYALFWVQRWLGRDEIVYVPSRQPVARGRRLVVVQRIRDGQAVFGMHKDQ